MVIALFLWLKRRRRSQERSDTVLNVIFRHKHAQSKHSAKMTGASTSADMICSTTPTEDFLIANVAFAPHTGEMSESSSQNGADTTVSDTTFSDETDLANKFTDDLTPRHSRIIPQSFDISKPVYQEITYAPSQHSTPILSPGGIVSSFHLPSRPPPGHISNRSCDSDTTIPISRNSHTPCALDFPLPP